MEYTNDFICDSLDTEKGSDPRAATCRGKLQNKRSKLNQEINKEMMMRSGAEKLFKVTKDRKLKENIALELSFVNSSLQLLKEELSEMNSSVDIYQNESSTEFVPMIPLGLKETKEIDFNDAFKDFILEHYSEDGNIYEDAINELTGFRQAIRTPLRDLTGVQLLFEYYNHLYFIERRFFPPDRSLGIFFEWYDSLTGVPSCQRSVAFEKASILFNIAALYTQMGAKQDRTTTSGSDAAVDNFLRAAGMFRYINEGFSKAPSMDLSTDTLEMLVHLMLAQARECIFEKLTYKSVENQGLSVCIEIAQEAAEVADVYSQVYNHISSHSVKDYVPYSWISLVQVKAEHYRAMAHHYAAVGLIEHLGDLTESLRQSLDYLHVSNQRISKNTEIYIPQSVEARKLLGKAHMRESLLLHEEALRLHRMCRQLRKVDTLQVKLKSSYEISVNKYADMEDEDDFQEVLDPPEIQPSTKYQLTLTAPDFSHSKVQDLFHKLGPIGIFCSKLHWTAPRTVKLGKAQDEGFGFSIRGDAPVIIAGLDIGSLSEVAGIKEGDFIVGIGNEDTKWSNHDEVVSLIRLAGNSLILKLVTPMDKNYLNPKSSPGGKNSVCSSSGVSSGPNSPTHSPTGSLSSGHSKDSSNRKKLTWNIFRKSREKERIAPGTNYDCNIVLR